MLRTGRPQICPSPGSIKKLCLCFAQERFAGPGIAPPLLYKSGVKIRLRIHHLSILFNLTCPKQQPLYTANNNISMVFSKNSYNLPKSPFLSYYQLKNLFWPPETYPTVTTRKPPGCPWVDYLPPLPPNILSNG